MLRRLSLKECWQQRKGRFNMKTLKVWGGLTFRGCTQCRTIVATYTKKKACELVNISIGELNDYWSETGNEIELKLALANPEIVFVELNNYKQDFVKIKGELK